MTSESIFRIGNRRLSSGMVDKEAYVWQNSTRSQTEAAVSVDDMTTQPLGAFWKLVMGFLSAAVIALFGTLWQANAETARTQGRLETLERVTGQHTADIRALQNGMSAEATLGARYDERLSAIGAAVARIERRLDQETKP